MKPREWIIQAVQLGNVSPDAVLLEAVFDELPNAIRNRFDLMGVPSFPSAELLIFWGGRQMKFDAFDHRPVVYARAIVCPALFLHGENDRRATVDQ